MADLIATKTMTYATRRLQAEDTFTASRRDARILVAIGKARYVSSDAIADDDLPALRDAYKSKLGKRPFNGWDADTLRAKIAEAEG
ncbi:hypothetical protein [Brevundimonas sp.]|uniref:hypothetical protein n=1 Tax=Brevundimonas sp. TaxID=1871086 RepID=UPI0028AA4849|nr:hypothetical protein [Brevundimonas sp.]